MKDASDLYLSVLFIIQQCSLSAVKVCLGFVCEPIYIWLLLVISENTVMLQLWSGALLDADLKNKTKAEEPIGQVLL